MKLLIDVGNSRIKWTVADGDRLDGLHVLPVDCASELPSRFAGLEGIRQVWVSNVAGAAIAQHIRDACPASAPLYFIVAQKKQCGVRNSYTLPAQLGCDRWAALIAAWHMVRGACLVVNSGTATTIDSLSASGEFIGGLILPGVEMMMHSLCSTAVQLQTAQSAQGKYLAFPLNTVDAVYSGALQASCGAIEQQYALLGEVSSDKHVGCGIDRGGSAPIVLSGGAAALLQNHLSAFHVKAPLRMVDNLVLHGICLISQDA